MSSFQTQHDDALQSWLKSQPKFVRELLAGGVAGAVSKTSVAPLERAKILYQTHRLSNLGVAGILAHLYKTEGIQGLYRGNSASVLRIVPYAAIHFALYERYKRVIVQRIHTVPEAAHDHDPHVQKTVQAAWLEKQHVHPVWDLIAGSAAGASAVLLTYPLDLARTRMAWATDALESSAQQGQPMQSFSHTHSSPGRAQLVTQQPSSYAAEGTVYGVRPMHSCLQGQHASGCSHGGVSSSKGAWPLTAGRSRALAATARANTPGSAVAHHIPHPGLSATLLQTLQNEGFLGLYKGVGPTLLGILPYAGLKFYVYQSFKAMYRKQQQQQQPVASSTRVSHGSSSPAAASSSSQRSDRLPVHYMLLFGGVSGLVAQTVTYPLDVIRRTMQVEGYQIDKQEGRAGGAGSHTVRQRSTTMSIARRIVAEEGYKGLMRGLYINYMKIFPTTAIGFTVYDHLKQYMDLGGTI